MKYSHVILVFGPLKSSLLFWARIWNGEEGNKTGNAFAMELKSSLISMFWTIMKDVTSTVMANNNNKIIMEWKAKERKNTTNLKPQCLYISVKQITRITARLNWKRNLNTLSHTYLEDFIRMAINLQVFLFMVVRVFALTASFFFLLWVKNLPWKMKEKRKIKQQNIWQARFVSGNLCTMHVYMAERKPWNHSRLSASIFGLISLWLTDSFNRFAICFYDAINYKHQIIKQIIIKSIW